MRIAIRDYITEKDPDIIYQIVKDTGYFSEDELIMARELAISALAKPGEYLFFVAEDNLKAAGYACYGKIPCSIGSFELYWIAVLKGYQHNGIGRALINSVESAVRSCGGKKLFVSTSSTDRYAPTRAFYEDCAYTQAAVLKDYFAPGDHEVIYEKPL
ncbi:MAG: GNAT family N-acetyltransferase [Deferribacteraceae bacterium]|jgi:ribosomal protein S18 acetylase RimI-like enzyme|nr:GNAT family N-acetyltransferase [Deferribacteraceae bacterium]